MGLPVTLGGSDFALPVHAGREAMPPGPQRGLQSESNHNQHPLQP